MKVPIKLPGIYGQAPAKNAPTFVVSIHYLTKPFEVLESLRRQTVEGGKVHLAVSNRCIATKVVNWATAEKFRKRSTDHE